MSTEPHRTMPYDASDERPPWQEHAADPTYWDIAFGSYGDGYLEWVTNRYFRDVEGPRTIADTRALWDQRARYLDDAFIAELNAGLRDTPRSGAA